MLGGVQAGEGCGQEGGKTTQSQKCMGLESKASLVSAGEGTLFNPQKWLSSWFRALQHMRFPRACQEMGAPQRTVRSSNQGDKLRAGGGGAGQSMARLDPMCICSSSEISTGTTQMGKPDSIYSPRKRGYLCPQAPAGHHRQSGVARVYGARWPRTERNRQVTEPPLPHLENGGGCVDWSARSGPSSGSVAAHPSGLVKTGPGALTSRDPAESPGRALRPTEPCWSVNRSETAGLCGNSCGALAPSCGYGGYHQVCGPMEVRGVGGGGWMKSVFQ